MEAQVSRNELKLVMIMKNVPTGLIEIDGSGRRKAFYF
jgi:hypothetical protein